MSMIEKVRAEMVAAMKNKEKERKESLSMLLSALKNKAIDKRADLAPADRTDIIEQCRARLSVLAEFAQEEMSEDAIRAVIREVIEGLGIENPTGKDKGRIMKELMPKVKGKADGALVNKLAGETLA